MIPGEYPPVILRNVHGSASNPLILTGPRDGTGRLLARISGDKGQRRDALELEGSSHVVVSSLEISGARRAGIRINNSHNIRVLDTRITSSGLWGIFSNHANDVEIRDNTLLGPAEQHGIYLSNSGDRGIIAGNHIAGFRGCGIQLNGDIEMGGSSGVEGDGIIDGITIEANIIAANGSAGGAAINLDGASRTTIRANIIAANRSAGIAMFRVDGGAPTTETHILENLIVGTSESRSQLIFASGTERNSVEENVLVHLNSKTPMIAINNKASRSFLSRFTGSIESPSHFSHNSYASLGPYAMYGESFEMETFDDWVEAANDHTSRRLTIDLKTAALEVPEVLQQIADGTISTELSPQIRRLLDAFQAPR